MTTSQPLLVRPIPYPDESASSLLIRAAELNGHASIGSLLMGSAMRIDHSHIVHLTTHQTGFQSLLNRLGLNLEYTNLAFKLSRPTARSARYWGNIEIPPQLFHTDIQVFCPLCLREKPYWRKIWLLKPIAVCPTHDIILHDRCPHCHKPLSVLRGRISICHRCGTDISTADTQQYEYPNAITWFRYNLSHGSTMFMKEFSEFWLTLQQFCRNEELPLSYRDQLMFSHEYFTNRTDSINRVCAWVNQRSNSVHPKIQMCLFLTGPQSLKEYAELILERCALPCQPTLQHKSRFLKRTEVCSILGITITMLDYWVSLGYLSYHTPDPNVPRKNKFLLSHEVQHVILNQSNLPIKHMENIISIDVDHDSLLHVSQIAARLHVHKCIIRTLLNTRFFTTRKKLFCGSWIVTIHEDDLFKFNTLYALTGTLAQELQVNSRNLAEKLMSLGIMPISGPIIDQERHYIFTRKSVEHINTTDIQNIKHYPTRTGRPPKLTIKVNPLSDYIPLRKAAEMLEISQNKTAVLVHKKILDADQNNKMAVMIKKKSLDTLISQLQSPEFMTVKEVMIRLKCPMNWIRQYWCLTGFLNVHDFVYWQLIRKEEFDIVIKLKEVYLTGGEASRALGMHRSHITNLQKQGLIKAVYLGSEHKVRLFKRTEVLALRERGYAKQIDTSV